MSATESPVQVTVADGVHVLIVGAVKKLQLQHRMATVPVPHLGFLPGFMQEDGGEGHKPQEQFQDLRPWMWWHAHSWKTSQRALF